MDWTVYWFMLPVCAVVAGVAMFSGAALLTPVFLIGFLLMGVPRLTTVAAIGTSLLLETSAFGTRLQGRISERAARVFFAGLFAAIGATFLLAFTVFVQKFG